MDVVEVVTSGAVGGAVAWVVAKLQLRHTEHLAAKDRIYHAWLELSPALSGATGTYLAYIEFETLKLAIGRFQAAVGGTETPLGFLAAKVVAAGEAIRTMRSTHDDLMRMAGRDPDETPPATDEERDRRRRRDAAYAELKRAAEELTKAAIAAARLAADD